MLETLHPPLREYSSVERLNAAPAQCITNQLSSITEFIINLWYVNMLFVHDRIIIKNFPSTSIIMIRYITILTHFTHIQKLRYISHNGFDKYTEGTEYTSSVSYSFDEHVEYTERLLSSPKIIIQPLRTICTIRTRTTIHYR
jgi:hypothetical protein